MNKMLMQVQNWKLLHLYQYYAVRRGRICEKPPKNSQFTLITHIIGIDIAPAQKASSIAY